MPVEISLHRDTARIKKTLDFHQRQVFPRAINNAVGRTTDRLFTQWVRQTSNETGIQQKKLRAKYTGRLMKFFRTTRGRDRIGRLWLGGNDLTFSYLGAVTAKGKISKRGRELVGTSGGVPFFMPVRPGSSKKILAVRKGDQIMVGINIFDIARRIKRFIVATMSEQFFRTELQGQLARLSRGKIRRG